MSAGINILEYFAGTNTAYLHAHSELATEYLIRELDLKEKENVLELGCGTGATMVKAASRFPASDFYAVEYSSAMYERAMARFEFSQIKNCDVHLLNHNSPFHLPFESGFFDKIYVESVLAIQDGELLSYVVKEISRVLKPEGRFVINETIWLPEISKEEIENINAFCKTHYGIIQANSLYAYPADWKALFQKYSFKIKDEQSLDVLTQKPLKRNFSYKEFLSDLFTFYGKMKRLISPRLKQQQTVLKNLPTPYRKSIKYMEGLLITAVKV
jgi:ubiquinone/menaquinone biosynthesis C-methylase UbiE